MGSSIRMLVPYGYFVHKVHKVVHYYKEIITCMCAVLDFFLKNHCFFYPGKGVKENSQGKKNIFFTPSWNILLGVKKNNTFVSMLQFSSVFIYVPMKVKKFEVVFKGELQWQKSEKLFLVHQTEHKK